MRTGSDPSVPDDFLLNPPEPIHVVTSVSPTPQPITSPVMSVIPMEPVPANVMSPDEMLRAYAERKKSIAAASSSSQSVGPINYPKPVVKKRSVTASLKGAGLRVLYGATRTLSPSSPSSPTVNTDSLGSVYTDDMSSAFGETGHGQQQADARVESSCETENMAGRGTVNPHPFGYHPFAYVGTYASGDDDDDGEAKAGQDVGTEAVHFGHAS
jgi:hypothetical protein